MLSMHIGINAHLLAFSGNYRQAGLSRYIDELLFKLPEAAPDLRFTGYVGGTYPMGGISAGLPSNLALSRSRLPTDRAVVRIAWEQTALPVAAMQSRLDLLHCPVNVRPVLAPCPTVITVHDLIFLRTPGSHHPAKKFYLSAMTGWSARRSAHVVAVSEATRKDVIELLAVDPRRVTTVHNGVGEEFKPVAEQQRLEFRRKKGIDGRVVLYVGTLEPRKNLPTLLRAFKQVAGEPDMSDVSLLIGGSKGWYYSEIFATAERLGLDPGRVRFLGRVPDEELPLWYNIATVFAYPSLYEGFGLPALEAMACGTPVLASDASALPEVIGDAGLLLDPSDEGAWAEGMRLLLADGGRRAALSRLGIEQAKRFSWRSSAQETAAVYRKLQAPGAGRRRA